VEQTLYIGASVMDNGNTVWCEGMLDDKNNFMKMVQFAMSAGK
jgi:hypothetical protein